jgi:hypothetical protein
MIAGDSIGDCSEKVGYCLRGRGMNRTATSHSFGVSLRGFVQTKLRA